jgi:hypothetical protein
VSKQRYDLGVGIPDGMLPQHYNRRPVARAGRDAMGADPAAASAQISCAAGPGLSAEPDSTGRVFAFPPRCGRAIMDRDE